MATVNLTNAEKRVEAAKKKLQQAQNVLRDANAKERARQQAQARKDRDRRLIITGAVVWNVAAENEEFRAQLMKWIDEGVPDPRNRSLFDFPAQKKQRPEGAGDERRNARIQSKGGTGGGS